MVSQGNKNASRDQSGQVPGVKSVPNRQDLALSWEKESSQT